MIPAVYEDEAVTLRHAEVTKPSSLVLRVPSRNVTLGREQLVALADALDAFLRERGLR